MSVQFGKVHFDGAAVDPKDLNQIRPVLAPYGPDGEGSICRNNFGALYRSLQTTSEKHDTGLVELKDGTVLIWDGRLDNRTELIEQANGELLSTCPDAEIVASAYARWQTKAFARLVGDWALSVWNDREQSLILAVDFMGICHLYYSIEDHRLKWSTVLAPLILFAGKRLRIEEEYIAAWFSSLPAPDLTPYVGIRSVPPSSFVRFTSRGHQVIRYWDFHQTRRIFYRTDQEYEEHFRSLFSQSVRRRLRSAGHVLAELSGGMDSSSIVCVADEIMQQHTGSTVRLDTVSYFNDGEPHWNERPYFTKVEEHRGRVGFHIDIGGDYRLLRDESRGGLALTPVSVSQSTASKKFCELLTSRQYRIVLSGIGGDEVLGGVPSAIPELADLLARASFVNLCRQLNAWALAKKRPVWRVLAELLSAFVCGDTARSADPAWIESRFRQRLRGATRLYQHRLRLWGPKPSFQENLTTLETLRRYVAHSAQSSTPPYESRYPYLDRDLLEFLYAIPRDQISRPHQRRSLMRRAMAKTVPNEILNRRRKAFIVHGPLAAIANEWPALKALTASMVSASAGFVNAEAFADALDASRHGGEIHVTSVMRTLEIENWLRHLCRWGFVTIPGLTQTQSSAG